MGIAAISPISGYSSYGSYAMYPIRPTNSVKNETEIPGIKDASTSGRVEKGECETCKNRKYVDGSNESDVSFQSPAHIDPNHAASKVMSHEREHVANAVSEGNKENKDLLNVSVTLHTSVCPECGRVYVSGGTTHSTIKTTKGGDTEPVNPYAKQQAKLNYLMSAGKNMDISA